MTRTAEGPLHPREITERMLKTEGIADPERKEFYKQIKSVSSALISHGDKGNLAMHDDRGAPFRWSLKGD